MQGLSCKVSANQPKKTLQFHKFNEEQILVERGNIPLFELSNNATQY